MDLKIIDYGAGNIKSIQFAFQRLGIDAILSSNPEDIISAEKVIFPGVGEASSAMKKLKDSGLDKVIPQLTQPVLGICLGMQLMCNHSEEGNTQGLGIFDVDVKKFKNDVKVPQMGWNVIKNLKSELFENINEGDYMYLVHSYYAEICSHTVAEGNYITPFSAALQKDNFYATQFHPEKSGSIGTEVLKIFLSI